MRFGPSGLNQAFDTLQKRAKDQGKDLATKEANFFLSLTRKLGWKAAPTREELDMVARKLKFRLKRKPGVTPAQELARRKRARGTFARGWVMGKIEQSGSRIRIWIVNFVGYSGKVEDEKHVAQTAANVVRADYQGKLNKLASKITSMFGK